VEEAVHSEVIDGITAENERWEKHERYLDTKRREEILGASDRMVDFDASYVHRENQSLGHVRTRLGQEDIVVTFTEPVGTPLGNTTEQATLSPYFFPEDGVPPDGETEPVPAPEGFRFTFEGENFTYTSLGIQNE